MNYKVLYAPSDYENEENFVHLQKAANSETLDKFHHEILNDESETLSDEISHNTYKYETKLKAEQFSTKKEREEQRQTVQKINRQRIKEARLVEEIILEKIQDEMKVTIERDMKFEISGNKTIFDGVIKNGNNLTAIEVHRLNKNTMNMSYWNNFIRHLNNLYSKLSNTKKDNFSLIFAVATDEEPSEMYSYLTKRLSDLKFKVTIKIYDFDEIIKTNFSRTS